MGESWRRWSRGRGGGCCFWGSSRSVTWRCDDVGCTFDVDLLELMEQLVALRLTDQSGGLRVMGGRWSRCGKAGPIVLGDQATVWQCECAGSGYLRCNDVASTLTARLSRTQSQFKPKTSSRPPLTAASTASASSLNALVSSSNAVPTSSFLSKRLSTPSARCSASSRSEPRNASIEVRRSHRRGFDRMIVRTVGDVAANARESCIHCSTRARMTYLSLRIDGVGGVWGHLG